MLIISKHKDFYDHVCHQYKDEKIVIDRRNAIVIDDDYILRFTGLISKKPKDAFKVWYKEKFPFNIHVLELQIGYTVYFFEIKNYNQGDICKALLHFKDEKCFVTIDFFGKLNLLVEEQQPVPVLMKLRYYNFYNKEDNEFYRYRILNKDYRDNIRLFDEKVEENIFILKNKFANFIYPDEIYKELDNYFVYQQRDIGTKPIPDDKAKIVNHGFDLKTSFRGK